MGPNRLYHYRFVYDANKRQTLAINSLGHATFYVYNERQRVIEQRYARYGAIWREWDERGNLLKEE